MRSANPFVNPALFRIRQFTGAALVMAPYSAAFGAMLLSIALWEQTVWGWSAFKTGLAIAPGPLLVPLTSLLVAGRLIARFGAAAVVTAGIALFAGALACWAAFTGSEPNMAMVALGMVPMGIGVGLTFPTLMGVSAAALPPSSFATGSGVINMIRQAALAIGVAIFVAVLGPATSQADRIAGFHRGWWLTAVITLLGLLPALRFLTRGGPADRTNRPARDPEKK
jgi:MFS family permease